MREIGDLLKADARAVVGLWQSFVSESLLADLPPAADIDHLPDVIVGLADAALNHPNDFEAHRRNVALAAMHGEHRRQRGYADSVIFTEYHLLHHAIWAYLKNSAIDPRTTAAAILRLDAELALDTAASLCGFHREQLTRDGRWPECLDRIAEESPLLQLPLERDTHP